MAGVEAIRLGTVSIQNLAASKENTPTTGGTKQFEQFLKNDNSSTQENASVKTVKEAKPQENMYEVSKDSTKQEQLQTIQKDVAATTDTSAKLSNEELTAMEAVQEELRSMIKESLDIDDNILDAVMQNMEIILTDLFHPEVLQQFVLVVNGGQENIDFLTDEGLMQSFTDLLQALENFQAENQNTLTALMEKLENPVTLEEFLQQEGIQLTEENAEVTEEFAAVLENAEVTVQEAVSTKQVEVVVNPMHSDKEVSMEKPVVVQQKNTDETTVEESLIQKENANTEDGSEDSFMEKEQADHNQNMDNLLFAEREELPAADRAVTTPLFAERFDSFVENGIRFLNADTGIAPRMQQMIDIVNQVSESIRSAVNADTTSVEMQLNPESLGKVFISVISKGGMMTATFNVQSEEAKNALESQILVLRENLEAKNLKVESVEVQVSDFSFTQSNQADGQNPNDYEKQGKKKFRYDTEESDSVEASEEVSAEQVRRQVMRDSGGSVDFTA